MIFWFFFLLPFSTLADDLLSPRKLVSESAQKQCQEYAQLSLQYEKLSSRNLEQQMKTQTLLEEAQFRKRETRNKNLQLQLKKLQLENQKTTIHHNALKEKAITDLCPPLDTLIQEKSHDPSL